MHIARKVGTVCFFVCRPPSPFLSLLLPAAVPKDGMGPAATMVPMLRGLFAPSSADDITICSKLCALVNKVRVNTGWVFFMGVSFEWRGVRRAGVV